MTTTTHGAARAKARPATDTFSFKLPTREYAAVPIPGLPEVRVGTVYAKVEALPETLDKFMEVNPRVPNRTAKGVLSGPVIKGILHTLLNEPETMAIRNQGIYLLVDSAVATKGEVTISLSDPKHHGIINGGHTYAAIREAIETASDDEKTALGRAYVPVHLLSGVPEDKVFDIAEGLNRSKQVDDPSLANLQGDFDAIRKVMKGQPGADQIAYHQGSQGSVYIADVLVFIEMFNGDRFSADKHPSYLYSRTKSALEFFQKDLAAQPSPLRSLVEHLPDILRLSDMIRRAVPDAAKRVGFEFGRMKTGKGKRAKVAKTAAVPLPFLADTMPYRVPDGWLYPMLAAFRANTVWQDHKLTWIIAPEELLPAVIDSMVRVCVAEHRNAGGQPDKVGKRESVYSQCYDKVALYLANEVEE